MEEKTASLFDHLSFITDKKKPWDSLSDADKKSFSPFMINRFLSMDPNTIEIVNEFQKYTVGVLEPKQVYQLYSFYLPKKKSFNKYIKSKKEDKYSEDLVSYVKLYFSTSKREALSIIEHQMSEDSSKLVELVQKYGKTLQEAKKIVGVK